MIIIIGEKIDALKSLVMMTMRQNEINARVNGVCDAQDRNGVFVGALRVL